MAPLRHQIRGNILVATSLKDIRNLEAARVAAPVSPRAWSSAGVRALGAALAVTLVSSCNTGEENGPTLPGDPASVVVSPNSVIVDLTASTTLTAQVKDAAGTTLSGATVAWASSNDQVATITANGILTGVGIGATSVSATSGNVSGSAEITVRQTLGSISILPATATLSVGATQLLTATVRDTRGNIVPGSSVAWATSDGEAATVSPGGLVTAVGAGGATLTASSGTVSGSASYKVVGITPAKPQRHGQILWTGPSPSRWGELYSPTAQWPSVQGRSHVVKLYIDDIYPASTQSLSAVVATLNRAHIAIAVEVGGLRDWNCSGTSLAATELAGLNRLVAAGGAISFLAMDAPFGYTLATSIPGNCRYTVQQTSEQLASYIHILRQGLPGVQIGLIEPVPWYSVGVYGPNPGNNFGDLPEVLGSLLTILAQHGESLDFFHADSPYDYAEAHPNGWDKLLALQQVVQGHGLRFGLIYNSDAGGQAGDQAFHDQTLAAFQAFHDVGGSPDDLIVQSWYPFPSAMVPEDQSYSFTNVSKNGIALYDQLYP